MRVRMKKRQVINHRYRSVSHSAFVPRLREDSDFLMESLEDILNQEQLLKVDFERE